MAPKQYDYTKAKIYLLHSESAKRYAVGSTTIELKNRFRKLKSENRMLNKTNSELDMMQYKDTKIYLLEEVPNVKSRKDMLLYVDKWYEKLEQIERS